MIPSQGHAGPVGVVPATDQIAPTVAGQVDQRCGAGNRNRPWLAGVVSEEVPDADGWRVVLRLKWRAFRSRAETDFKRPVIRIGYHPFQPAPVAVGKILSSGAIDRPAGCLVDHGDGVRIQRTRQPGIGDEFSEIDGRVHRSLAAGEIGHHGQRDAIDGPSRDIRCSNHDREKCSRHHFGPPRSLALPERYRRFKSSFPGPSYSVRIRN